MTEISEAMVERAVEAWKKIIRLEYITSEPDEDGIQEVASMRVVPRTIVPAMRDALDAALNPKE
jgi:hypothetical protein